MARYQKPRQVLKCSPDACSECLWPKQLSLGKRERSEKGLHYFKASCFQQVITAENLLWLLVVIIREFCPIFGFMANLLPGAQLVLLLAGSLR